MMPTKAATQGIEAYSMGRCLTMDHMEGFFIGNAVVVVVRLRDTVAILWVSLGILDRPHCDDVLTAWMPATA